MVSVGLFVGWASPTLPLLIDNDNPDYPVRLNTDQASWVVSLLTLGCIGGSITSALIVNAIGRKNTMLFTAVPSVISWLLIAFATSPWELYLSRFISGLAVGIAYASTPMYLGEISPAGIRGNLGSMLTVAVKLGTSIEFIIGPFLSVRNLALISLIAPCVFIVTFIWLPESPYYLMRCNAKQKAIESLVQLRGKQDVYKEADGIEQSVKADLVNKAGFRELLFVPGNRRALLTLTCLGMAQQLSGIQIVLQYAEMIFDEADVELEGKYLTMVLGAVQLVSVLICMMVTDRSGRKSLLIISCVGSACSTAMVAAYFHAKHNQVDISNILWLPILGVILYVVMYSLGLAGIPLTMASELYPTNVKALGTTTKIVITNIIAFALTNSYLAVSKSTGTHTPFWIFTVCSLVAALFTLLYVPETKGRTLEEIQEKLRGLSKKKEAENQTRADLSSVNV
ncbi:hypothetical protein PUN28_007289 [Cardiocondyla obscurior]